jgi:sugar lactone lactonase YvrE
LNAVWSTTGTTVQPTFHLILPRSISFDSSGNMYVADTLLCVIVKYPLCGMGTPVVYAGVSGSCTTGSSTFNQPEGAFIDTLGNLYVVSLRKANVIPGR